VKKGDVLCIVEAMKLMNEITAETDGVINKISCQNGQTVEFGQELFRIKVEEN
jgi:biotin carboxyl carrier protein